MFRTVGRRTDNLWVPYGAELSLGLSSNQAGVADPEGEHLLVLARGVAGYRRLCRVISL